jgi:restriction system protein
MAVPDFQGLMLPVLRAAADGDVSAADLRSRVAAELRLTEADLAEMLPSGRQTTFANRTAWANVFLQRAGLLEKVSRGVYRITDEGRKVLVERPERIDMRFLERYPAYVEWRQRSIGIKPVDGGPGVGPPAEDQTP